MLTPRLVWAVATSCLALSGVGCDRRGEEARPEPITLSRPAPARPGPARPGAEHGQDPRRAADAPRGAAPAREVETDDADDGGDDASDRDDTSEGRARRPAKRRRAGSVATRDGGASVSSSALRAKRLVVARDVEDREPVGVARSFDGSRLDAVSVFVELMNDAREETKIVVRFEPPTAAAFEVPLDVGAAPRWRTWASTRRPLEEGTWSVRVLDDEGATIARTTFEVVE